MPSTPQQIAAARAAKQAENQANRNRKKTAGAKVVAEVVERVLSHKEKEVAAAVVAELQHSLTQKGDEHADKLAQSTKFWMDWAYAKFPRHQLERFAAAEAQRWFEVRHPRPARPPRKDHRY
jgi:hypothetical protein